MVCSRFQGSAGAGRGGGAVCLPEKPEQENKNKAAEKYGGE